MFGKSSMRVKQNLADTAYECSIGCLQAFDPPAQDAHRPVNGDDVGRLIEPSADAGGMRKGQIPDAVADRGGADDVRERLEWPEERPDRQRADEQDDLGLEDVDQLVEPGAAEALLLGRR